MRTTCDGTVRLGQVIGLPVVLHGRMIGRVEQTWLTEDGRHLRGLVMRRGLGAARWSPWEDVLALGEVSVILRREPGKPPKGGGDGLHAVKDTGGMNLGRVTDVYVSRVTGRVTALEISLGLIEELTCGRVVARTFAVRPTPAEPGLVLIPCGCAVEYPQGKGVAR